MRSSAVARHTPGSLRAQQELQQLRRVMEEQRRDGCNRHLTDIRRVTANAQQYKKLGSQKTFQNSIDSYMKQQIEDKNNSDISMRRTELAVLLLDEESNCQRHIEISTKIELMEHVKDAKSQQMKEIQARVELLRQARVRQQEQIVSQKLQDVWKRDSQELRELKSKQVDMETAKAWGEQISIRKQSEEEDQMIDGQLVQTMKREVQLTVDRDDRKLQEEREKMKDLTEVWQDQCESLKRHEEQMKGLQQQEREWVLQLNKLVDMEEQRKKLENLEHRKELGRTLMTQQAAHIRQRNRQVQESLEFDRQLLDTVIKIEQESVMHQQQQKERARTVAAQIKESLEDRLQIEREREHEIDRLDREEARLYWQKREKEWSSEEDARKHLMNEVIGDLRAQLKKKVQANRQAQQEIERGKEEVSAMMRMSEMEKQRQIDHISSAQANRRDELDAQVQTLELKQQADRDDELKNRLKNKNQQTSYDYFLARETSKLSVGRRQSATFQSRSSLCSAVR